jgi:hypothetical protein
MHLKPMITAAFLLLPLLYVGSYAALVDPNAVRPRCGHDDSPSLPLYRIGGAHAERFYWPLETVDRRLRPETWHEATRFPFSTSVVPVTAPVRTANDPFDTSAAANPFE